MTSPEDSKPAAGGPAIPPFEEGPGTPASPFKAIAQLFLVPALIVAAAVGVFLAMNFLVGGEVSPEDLLDQAASGDSRRRGQAAFELAKVIARDPSVVEDPTFRTKLLVIYERSASESVELRRYLTQVLSHVQVPEAIPELIEATHDQDPHTKLFAAVALGNLQAEEAVPRLIDLTTDDDPGVRIVAVNALGYIGDPVAEEALQARLNDPHPDVTWNAASALAYLGNEAGQAVLIEMLQPGYLQRQEGITPEQAQQAMLIAVEGLARLEAQGSDPARVQALERTADDAVFPGVQAAAMTALKGPK